MAGFGSWLVCMADLMIVCASGFAMSLQDPSQKRVRLSGYGVELAIKSTEYKAKDDTKVEGQLLELLLLPLFSVAIGFTALKGARSGDIWWPENVQHVQIFFLPA